jgi:antitoxin component of MazEF toxin-antitoxin module
VGLRRSPDRSIANKTSGIPALRAAKRDVLRICKGREIVSQVTVGKWGKNLAIRLPDEIVKAAGLSDGERVEIETLDGDIVVRRAVPRFTLEELFRGKSPEEWRAAYAGAFDWGPDVGREAVEE